MTMSGKRILWLLAGVIWMAAIIFSSLQTQKAYATNPGQITNRSLTLEAGASAGGSAPGGVVNHLFTFTVPNVGGGNVGSIKFEYCTAAREATCTSATTIGLDTSAATLGPVTIGGTPTAGFTLAGTNGAPYITRTAAAITANSVITVELDSVTNPTQPNTTFFAEITTYASTDTSGSPIDEGWVAASTANQIVLTGTMPESLIFCTGGTITVTNNIPDCSSATTGSINFPTLFSPTATAQTTSQMAASTNAQSGYAITVNGATLKSGGTNSITAMSTAGASVKGTSQFGMNLVKNTDFCGTGCDLGADINPTSNGTNLNGAASSSPEYNTAATFKFTSGDTVATSSQPTDGQDYTVSYIVNVDGAQPPGTYTTTLSYICTATY